MRKLLLLTTLLAATNSFAANQTDLDKLLALKKEQTVRLDLSNTDLRKYPFVAGKIDLRGANITHSNLSGVDLSKMDLTDADLSYADLSGARLNQVNLTGANLNHANLNNAEILQSNFSRADLSFATLVQTNLQQALFTDANLTCANLNQANLSKAVFTNANISGATWVNTITNDVSGYQSVNDRQINCEVGSLTLR